MNGALSVDYKLKMAGMPNNDFWLDEIKIFRNYMTDGIVLCLLFLFNIGLWVVLRTNVVQC